MSRGESQCGIRYGEKAYFLSPIVVVCEKMRRNAGSCLNGLDGAFNIRRPVKRSTSDKSFVGHYRSVWST